MTQSMLEKVARAIGVARCEMTGGTIELIPSDMLLARAAMEAMREPTDVMVDAGQWEVDPVALFQNMIDASLKGSDAI